jgi:UDP-N-acetylglucosamine 2-epimerase
MNAIDLSLTERSITAKVESLIGKMQNLTEEAIKRSIKKVYDTNIYKKFYNLKNPYDKSKTSFKIAKVLKSIKQNKLYNKNFFDIK